MTKKLNLLQRVGQITTEKKPQSEDDLIGAIIMPPPVHGPLLAAPTKSGPWHKVSSSRTTLTGKFE